MTPARTVIDGITLTKHDRWLTNNNLRFLRQCNVYSRTQNQPLLHTNDGLSEYDHEGDRSAARIRLENYIGENARTDLLTN